MHKTMSQYFLLFILQIIICVRRQEAASVCTIDLVESIPENLTYPHGAPSHMSTYESWKWLINSTRSHLNLVSFYWTLGWEDVMNKSVPSAKMGEDILASLNKAVADHKFKLQIVTNGKKNFLKNKDLLLLSKSDSTSLRWLDVTRFFNRGIIHTKMWTSDSQHAYVGSANMDFRSLSQVKELGLFIRFCPKIVTNLDKIFAVNYYLAEPNDIPQHWPSELRPLFNSTNPLQWANEGALMNISVSSSPVEFNPNYRDNDISNIIRIIKSAKTFVYISVMDYLPQIVSYNNQSEHFPYWSTIDDALREAATTRQITVRLLISQWKSTRKSMKSFLLSLNALGTIKNVKLEARFFVVPTYNEEQKSIPFCRVNHNKYMVTDNTAYIGTSNWSGDYFLYTGGVGFAMTEVNVKNSNDSLRMQTEAIFLRDWNSKYTHQISL